MIGFGGLAHVDLLFFPPFFFFLSFPLVMTNTQLATRQWLLASRSEVAMERGLRFALALYTKRLLHDRRYCT